MSGRGGEMIEPMPLHWYRCQVCGNVRALRRELSPSVRCYAVWPVIGWAGAPNEQVVGTYACKGVLEPIEVPAHVS